MITVNTMNLVLSYRKTWYFEGVDNVKSIILQSCFCSHNITLINIEEYSRNLKNVYKLRKVKQLKIEK